MDLWSVQEDLPPFVKDEGLDGAPPSDLLLHTHPFQLDAPVVLQHESDDDSGSYSSSMLPVDAPFTEGDAYSVDDTSNVSSPVAVFGAPASGYAAPSTLSSLSSHSAGPATHTPISSLPQHAPPAPPPPLHAPSQWQPLPDDAHDPNPQYYDQSSSYPQPPTQFAPSAGKRKSPTNLNVNTSNIGGYGASSSLDSPLSGSDSEGSLSPAPHKRRGGKKRKTAPSDSPNPIDDRRDLSDEQRRELKRQQRLLRNRVSAQLSRERKKAYVKQLEAKLEKLQQENDKLMSQVSSLTSEVSHLRSVSTDPSQTRMARAPRMPQSSSYLPSTTDDAPYFHPYPEDSNPRALKRLKVFSPRAAAKTGMVLFALVFSFGVFYHLAGIDFDREKVKLVRLADDAQLTPGVFHGRVLQSIDSDSSDEEIESPSSPQAKALSLVAVIGDGSSDSKRRPDSEVDVLSPVHMRALTQQLSQKMRGFSMRGNRDELAVDRESKVDTDIVLPAITINDQSDEGRALDLFRESQTQLKQSLIDAISRYRQMVLRNNNGTLDPASMPSSIMFCPTAMHIQPNWYADSHNTNSTHIATHMDVEGPARATARPRSMLLWVPSNDIAASWIESSPSQKPGGITELNVNVMNVASIDN